MNFPSRVKNDKRWGLGKLKNTNIQEIIKGRRTYGGATEKKKKQTGKSILMDFKNSVQCGQQTQMQLKDKIWDHLWYSGGWERDDRGWDGWMASPNRWTWVWTSSWSWWWTGKPGVLQSMESQRVRHNWETELKGLHSVIRSLLSCEDQFHWSGGSSVGRVTEKQKIRTGNTENSIKKFPYQERVQECFVVKGFSH